MFLLRDYLYDCQACVKFLYCSWLLSRTDCTVQSTSSWYSSFAYAPTIDHKYVVFSLSKYRMFHLPNRWISSVLLLATAAETKIVVDNNVYLVDKQIHSYIKWTYWVPSVNIKRLIDRGHLIDHITSNSLKKWPIQRLHTDYAANCADDITLMSLNRHRSFLWRPKSLDNAVETIKWMHILFNWWCRLSERCYYRWPPNNE